MIPSIDVRGGRVVRLLRGDYAHETVFGDDPVAVVVGFADAGAQRVHVVDLDAARGAPDAASSTATAHAVAALSGRGVAVQVGGGVRDRATAERWLDGGATYVVVGSLAVRDPQAAAALCAALPGRVLLGLDVRAGRVQAEGWTQAGGDAAEVLDEWSVWPAAGLVHTEVDRDGTKSGPALGVLAAVCARYRGPVIASGGVTTLDDVAACAEAGAAGAIVGRALHDGSFDLHAALQRFDHGAAA